MKRLLSAALLLIGVSFGVFAQNSSTGKVTKTMKGSELIDYIRNNNLDDKTVTITFAPNPKLYGHEYVDLGLSVKWATCNLGASRPEHYGGYYQWGGLKDVKSTSIYLDWSNCPYHKGSYGDTGWTKYVPSNKSSYWSGSGSPDNKTRLEMSDDVARSSWGGKWRMPTYAEWQELIDNCTSEWTTLNGVKGRKFTSRKNGNSIFLPAAGYRSADGLDTVGFYGFYWSSSLTTDYPDGAYGLYFSAGDMSTNYYFRCNGRSVRPVSE